MHNLKNGGGSFKGYIGECMFKLTDKYLVLTRFFSKNKYASIFGKYLSKEQFEFVYTNWYSIDAIKICFDTGKQIIIYEIKTRNKYDCPKSNWATKFTQNSIDLYKKAIGLDFKVTVATVWILEDWNYEIEFEDFQDAKYCIDESKTYDKQSGIE